jgi:biotin synthase
MDMFNALGLLPKRPFADGFVPEIVEEEVAVAEEIKWSRPGHRIEANVKYAEMGKEKRKTEKTL